MENLLEVRDLRTYFYTYRGVVRALEGITFNVKREETLGLVGETGCGKSVSSKSILRLIQPPGQIIGGEIYFNGRDLRKISDQDMRAVRGGEISMIMQEPKMSLNPTFRVGYQIAEALMLHGNMRKKEASRQAVEMLREVHIPNPQKVALQYPVEWHNGS
jgi:ABC-type dipeptide/oligopeptide/nickel transport system ATPase component